MNIDESLHVVMVPWSAFGHLMPFLQLSTALARSGVKVSFVSTPRIIQRLPKPPPELSSLLHFVEFPLPSLDRNTTDDHHKLPEGSEATVDVPFEEIQYLKVAYDLLRHPFKQFVADKSPDWIITDMISYWTAEIAREYQVPLLYFSVFSASTYAFFANLYSTVGNRQRRTRPSPESLTSVPEWINFPSSLAYRPFEAEGMHIGLYGSNASGITDAERIHKIFHACKGIAIRSCPEYEGEYLDVAEKLVGKPVVPVGFLPPENSKGRDKDHTFDESWCNIFDWLDKQKPSSVIFVGFGSECKLTKEQVYEIAYGLELSGLPFIWALRKPDWTDENGDALPARFGERTRGRGVVSIGWAPQMDILSHPSIGGSLFHSGWGSVIEVVQFGHHLVLLPLIVDQPLNARVIVEKGLGVEVERRADGSFTRDDIAKALKLAMESEEGEKMRVRAREAALVFENRKLQDGYFSKFVEYLKTNVEPRQKLSW